jgi:heat shock protein HslJ
MKKIIVCAVILLIIGAIAGGVVYLAKGFNSAASQQVSMPDPKNTEYVINGVPVKLINGISEIPAAPGSASKIVTKYFGNEVKKDLNGDGREDVVFLLTQETGGSGVFYYAVASLNTENGYVGSEGLLLGDRIAPQATENGSGNTVVVTYADRAPGEAFSVAPSVAKSIILLLDPDTMQFGEVVGDFEGEADPARMTLGMKKWNWISVTRTGQKMTPQEAQKFTLTFEPENTFSATTDCNSMSGSYAARGTVLTFSKIASTKMYCDDSQEADFLEVLETSDTYYFTSRGELILNLSANGGTAVFK